MDTEHADPRELAALRAAFGFGAAGRPALGWGAVRAFEAKHGVVLPEPYRTFVAEVADGAEAGPPAYGLVGPAEPPRGRAAGRPARELGRPFPLTSAWVWEDDPRPAEEIDPLVDRVLDHGSVVLGTEGCGVHWHLVVTGPHRGHVWSIGGEGAVPFGAEFGSTTAGPGFAGWVAHWAAGRPWFNR
ncbi:SMI1/KNR4 family protein [Kitasatospora sp. NPDC097605]|uniref:SMI1/KNR4 family protein n=1 Tax=Kitasatospora sp. NPDC097605 TaxID=3157226 RepID=UPI00331AFEDF